MWNGNCIICNAQIQTNMQIDIVIRNGVLMFGCTIVIIILITVWYRLHEKH